MYTPRLKIYYSLNNGRPLQTPITCWYIIIFMYRFTQVLWIFLHHKAKNEDQKNIDYLKIKLYKIFMNRKIKTLRSITKGTAGELLSKRTYLILILLYTCGTIWIVFFWCWKTDNYTISYTLKIFIQFYRIIMYSIHLLNHDSNRKMYRYYSH